MSLTKPNLTQLKKKQAQLKEKLAQKLKLIGESDGPMESRFPTGRFDLENEIELLKIRINNLNEEIKQKNSSSQT